MRLPFIDIDLFDRGTIYDRSDCICMVSSDLLYKLNAQISFVEINKTKNSIK